VVVSFGGFRCRGYLPLLPFSLALLFELDSMLFDRIMLDSMLFDRIMPVGNPDASRAHLGLIRTLIEIVYS